MAEIMIRLLPGLLQSLSLAAAVLVVGLTLGLLLGVVMRFGGPIVRNVTWALTELGRGFPALVTLYLVYFGLPELGLTFGSFSAVVLGFGFTTASYTADIFRTAIANVSPQQWEAGAALGVNRSMVFIHIILPQALRRVVAPVVSFSIIIFQGTSLAYSIGEEELLSIAYSQGTLSFDVMPYLLAASFLYLFVVLVLQAFFTLSSRQSGSGRFRPRISNRNLTSITGS